MIENLFVYGTLKPGGPNEHILAKLKGTWQPATVVGTLRDEGWGSEFGSPGIDLEEPNETVEGFLFQSSDLGENWAMLDEFEGTEYRRVLWDVTKDDGETVVGPGTAVDVDKGGSRDREVILKFGLFGLNQPVCRPIAFG